MKLSTRRPAVVAVAGVAVLTVALGGTAVGAAMLTGADIKDGTLTGADIKNGTVRGYDVTNGSLTGFDVKDGTLTGADVKTGSVRGHDLTTGTVTVNKLTPGAVESIRNGVFVGRNWGNILRNTLGASSATLRSGPYATNFGQTTAPPRGKGSLELQVADAASKVSYGNEVDFTGLKVADIGATSFSVYTVGENTLNNLPNITLEIDPNLINPAGGAAVHYSSMVFVPTGAVVGDNGKFRTYNANAAADGFWYFTNAVTATQTSCGQSANCTLAQALAGLDTAVSKTAAATVHSVAIGKGRDAQFHGSVDELKIFGSTYDFEQRGVIKH